MGTVLVLSLWYKQLYGHLAVGWRQPWNNKTKSPGGRTAYEEAPGIKPNETKRNEAKQGERLREMSALSAEAVAASGFKPLVATKSNTSFSNKSTLEGSEFAAKEKNHFLNEQVSAGPKASLHKSLSQGAIAAARDKAEDHSLLKRIPHELATTEGEAGQMLRRVMLHGSSIVFFTPGYAGKRFIYERARDLHVRVVIIDEREIHWNGLAAAVGNSLRGRAAGNQSPR
jgi:hypothetical protein